MMTKLIEGTNLETAAGVLEGLTSKSRTGYLPGLAVKAILTDNQDWTSSTCSGCEKSMINMVLFWDIWYSSKKDQCVIEI